MQMSTLTRKQKKKIADALLRGIKDPVIAKVLEISVEDVARERKSKGLSCKQVTETRYEYWKKLLYAGRSLKEIGELYGVSPYSVKLMLWKKERFSMMDVRKKISAERTDSSREARTSASFNW
jgi:hypothetical protein